MAYGDTMAYELICGSEKKIVRLTYNVNTYLIYKRFFDSDLMGDILKFTNTDKSFSKEIQSKISNGEITIDNIDNMDFDNITTSTLEVTFLLQIIIAMIATYEKSIGIKHSVDEIADSLPPYLLTDADFIQVFTEFLMFGLKKNKSGISELLSSVLVKRK